MSRTPEQCRRYAPAINEAVRADATVRLAATIDAIDPPARTGRPRLWSTLIMLHALWWLCRAGAAWALLPSSCPPRQTIGSRLERWVRLGVLDRALAVLNACLRLARGRNRRPSAGILDTQSVRTGPQPSRPARVRRAQEGQGPQACAADRHRGPGPGVARGARLGPGQGHPGLARARVRGGRPARGVGRPRPPPRARRGPSRPAWHRPRAGRPQGEDGLRGGATTVEDRADLRLSPALPAPPGRPRGRYRDVADHDLACRAVHDRRPVRAAAHGVAVFGTALR